MAEVVLALDVESAGAGLRVVDRLPGLRWVKLGSVLMTREGPGLVRELRGRGLEIFLDLKWHDIPNTVAGAVRSARELGVAMATVHTLGGRTMLEAAVRVAGEETALVGVTVLTSHDAPGYAGAVGRERVDLVAEVARLADVAAAAGLAGVVCSPHEVATVSARLRPDSRIVVPGIRRAADRAGDQVRVATAADAARAGATHLVVGRPILEAADPAAVFAELAEEAGCAV